MEMDGGYQYLSMLHHLDYLIFTDILFARAPVGKTVNIGALNLLIGGQTPD